EDLNASDLGHLGDSGTRIRRDRRKRPLTGPLAAGYGSQVASDPLDGVRRFASGGCEARRRTHGSGLLVGLLTHDPVQNLGVRAGWAGKGQRRFTAPHVLELDHRVLAGLQGALSGIEDALAALHGRPENGGTIVLVIARARAGARGVVCGHEISLNFLSRRLR